MAKLSDFSYETKKSALAKAIYSEFFYLKFKTYSVFIQKIIRSCIDKMATELYDRVEDYFEEEMLEILQDEE